jgi:hypothetical protein
MSPADLSVEFLFTSSTITAMNRMKKNLWVLGLLLSLLPYGIYLSKFPLSPMRDWGYFNSLSLMVHDYLMIGQWPSLDPWVCGGIDLMANPQNWIFSPLVLLNLIPNPLIANVFSLLICAVFGFWGMLKLTEGVKEKLDRILLCALFNLSPFFFLHFGEGHIPYRTFYLLPFVLFFVQKLRSLRELWWLTLILSIMFLDGGLYPFYFSLLLIAFNVDYRILKGLLLDRKLTKNWILLLGSFLFLLASKVIPVLSVHLKREPLGEVTHYDWESFVRAFYNIFQTNYNHFENMSYGAHEYSHYLGGSLTLLFVWGLWFAKAHRRLVVQLFIFIWMALGIGGIFNPWSMIKLIPFANHMHVQSRFLIIVFLLILVLIQKAVPRSRIKTALLAIGCAELLFCAFYINTKAFTEYADSKMMKVTPIDSKTANYEEFIMKPDVYRSGKLSFSCYEPARPKNLRTLNLFVGAGVENLRATFDHTELRITSSAPMPEKFLVNMNWNGGWNCEGCESSQSEGVIEVRPKPTVKEILLRYHPYNRSFAIMSCLLGVIFLALGYRKIKHEL